MHWIMYLVTPGGGAGLFGNAALAGTIFLVSRLPRENSAAVNLSLGNENTYDATAYGAVVHAPVSIAAFAERFSTSGYPVLRDDQRGPIDNNGSADSSLFRVDSEIQLDATSSLRLSGDRFQEERGNGTTYTENGTDGADLSAVFTKKFLPSEGQLALSAYFQWRNYHSTFSSVNAARTVETPALDQFHVPANAAGASAVWSMALPAQHRITLGGDFRWVEGETNEWFRFIGGEFTRLRIAGGDQLFAGAFAEDTWTPNERLTIIGSARFDYWQLYDGFRHEFNRANGGPTLLSNFSDRDGEELNGRLGARLSITNSFAIRAAGYTGFRVPTLNELYRPFRVGNDVTDSNAALNPEHLSGCEAGFEWRPTSSLTFTATGFYDHLEDAIGNVTISTFVCRRIAPAAKSRPCYCAGRGSFCPMAAAHIVAIQRQLHLHRSEGRSRGRRFARGQLTRANSTTCHRAGGRMGTRAEVALLGANALRRSPIRRRPKFAHARAVYYRGSRRRL